MALNDFKTKQLSSKIINALIEATKSHVEMNTLLTDCPRIKPILSDMLLSLDIYYLLHDTQPDICQIVSSLYISNESTTTVKTIHTINACIEYAQNKVKETDFLTTIDLLKIDESIKTTSIKPFEEKYPDKPNEQVEAIWSILHDLYEPQRQYPLLLEIAIACYRLLTFSDKCSFSLQTITILFSNLYQGSFAFRGLHKQWILFTDPRLNLASMRMDDALIHILYVFQQIGTFTTALIRKLKSNQEELSQVAQTDFRHQLPAELYLLIAEKICIRNQDVFDKLQISPETTTKYLKLLEQGKLLNAIKNGRELFYFNNVLLNLLKQIVEVSDNGAKKP